MEKSELVAASAKEGASAVKDSAQVQEKEEVVIATEAEAAPVEEQISIVAEGDAKRSQECVFEPETALAVEEEPVGHFMRAPTEDPIAVASEAPGDPIMEMSEELSELIEEVMREAALVEGQKALMADQVAKVAVNVVESSVEAAELDPATEIVEESSVEAEPAPKVDILEDVAVAPREEDVVESEAALAVEEQEFHVPPKHAVFLSHSGEQKDFVRRLSVNFQGCFLHPFFDLFEDSLPFGENFAVKICDAIMECHVGVVVLSEKFFTSKWPMLELVAMVDRAKRTKGLFKILPVFYSISTEDIAKNRKSWMSTWRELARKKPEGVDVEKWADAIDYIPKAWGQLATQKPTGVEEVELYASALDYICPVNGLKHDRKNDLELENKIVDVVCQLAPPEIRLDDSHIQGRDRLCKVIQDKIVKLQKDNETGVCMVGLHGMHGFGKTSICKALCNRYNIKFRRKVCHVELGRGGEEDLMREVLKKLTSMSQERLNGFKYDELCMVLREGIVKDAVFLAVDNMMNTDASIAQARHYLSARLPPGSIVMVTTHSKDSLMELRGLMDERNCLEMPELMAEEAKSLFIRSCGFNGVNGELVNHCIKLCYFKKGDDFRGCHYHPLALHVLGKQLECIDPKRWRAQLDKIDEDIFNQRNEDSHPIFSILRRSFDTLSPDDQLLYMDVALFVFYGYPKDVLEWLGWVHNIPEVDNVLSRLQRLKTKSLLESLGDGVKTGIRMHDLWHKFCVAETKHGKLKRRRWVYELEKWSELVNTSPSLSTCWGDVKRMAFLDPDVRRLEGVNFSYFPNVVVLKIMGIKMTKKVVLDLSGLTRLKSLEILGSDLERLVVLGLPRGLHVLCLRSEHDFFWKSVVNDGIKNHQKFERETIIKYNFLHWESITTSPAIPLIKQLACLRDLKFLLLVGLKGGTLLDMRSMASMQVLDLVGCKNAVTLTGLSSRMTNLRELYIRWCRMLRSCPGVGDLVNLEVLRCKGCYRLKRLPNLQKLRKLRILDIRRCPIISEVPGLSDLEALEELYAGSMYMRSASDDASYSIRLPDMRKLSRLRVLRLCQCSVMAMSGFENLISLQEVEADFRRLVDKPSLRRLIKLRDLDISGWNSERLEELINLTLLHAGLEKLHIRDCPIESFTVGRVHLPQLKALCLNDCESLEQWTIHEPMNLLSTLEVKRCTSLTTLPDLCDKYFPALEKISLRGCSRLTILCSSGALGGLRLLDLSNCNGMEELPDLGLFPVLQSLWLSGCSKLTTLRSSALLTALQALSLYGCSGMEELPDLELFPALKSLWLNGCSKLTTLHSSKPLIALQMLNLFGCNGVEELPDLKLFPALEELWLNECSKLTTLHSSKPLTALRVLDLHGCNGVEELPDLKLFPALEELWLKGCSKLTTLRSSEPLTALRVLDLYGCNGVEELPDLKLFPALEKLWLKGCSKLTTLHNSEPLTALQTLNLYGCNGVEELPDLKLFPALEKLWLKGCSKLTTLHNSGPLLALKVLDVRGCRSLSQDDTDQIQASCPQCKIVFNVGVLEMWKWKAAGCFKAHKSTK